MLENQNRYQFVKTCKKRFRLSPTMWKFLSEYNNIELPITQKLTEETKLKSCHKFNIKHAWRQPKMPLITKTLRIAKRMQKYFPQWNVDGTQGYWLVKPGNLSSGNGVMCMNNIADSMNQTNRLRQRVVQKLIERPLLLNLNTKSYGFHIKQWVLVTELCPLTIYTFDSFLLRIDSAGWGMKSASEISRRLSSKIKHRVGSSQFFERYMAQFYPDFDIATELLPKIHKIIIETLDVSHERLSRRQGCFQLFTFNFSLDYTLTPWLLKVSASPFPPEKNSWLTTMLDEMAEGLLKIVLDKVPPEGGYLYNTNFDPQGDISFNNMLWQGLFRGQRQPEGALAKVEMEVEGVRANYDYERELDRAYFANEAAVMIQKFTRGFFVRNVKVKKLREESRLKLQCLARMYIARCRRYHLAKARALNHISRITRNVIDQKFIHGLRQSRLAQICQRWIRGQWDRRVAHALAVQRAAYRIALVWRRYQGSGAIRAEKRWHQLIRFLQSWYKLRYHKRFQAAIRMQKLYRGHCGRAIYRIHKNRDTKSRLVQRWIRGFLGRRIAYHEKRRQAATRIQATVRRFVQRRKFIRYIAARRIQALVRMFIARQAYIKYIAARRIQSIVRIFLAK